VRGYKPHSFAKDMTRGT